MLIIVQVVQSTSMNDFSYIDDILKQAGQLLNDRFIHHQTDIKTDKDGFSNITTQTDYDSDQLIMQLIKQADPEVGFFTEESGEIAGNSDRYWIIDPLDGTNNFAHGIPYFGISALLLQGNTPLYSAICSPIRNRLITANANGQVNFNDHEFYKKNNPDRNTAPIITLNVGYAAKKRDKDTFNSLHPHVRRIMTMWAPVVDYSLFFEGYVDAVLSLDSEGYDSLPGLFIAQQASYPIYINQTDQVNYSQYNQIMPDTIVAQNQQTLDHIVQYLYG